MCKLYNKTLGIRSLLLLIGIAVLMLPSVAIASLLVNLDADNLNIGTITSWTNAGTLGGTFGNDTTTVNVVNMGGKRCINLTGSNRMKSSFNAPAGITGNAAHSVAYWVYNPAIAQNETVVSWSKAGTNGKDAQYEYGSSSTTGAADHAGNSYSMGWSGGAPTAGSWHHICITFSGTQCKVYKDGVLNGTKSMTLNINTAMPIIVGAGKTSAGAYTNYFSGYVHQVQVYDTALSLAEITTLIGRDAEVYLSNEIYYTDASAQVNVRKSQHFRIVWGKQDPSGLMTEDYVQGNLWQLENCWQRYHIYQGFHEPGVSVDPLYQDGNKYKVNFYISDTGLDRFVGDLGAFMGGDEHGFGYFSESPGYMRWDPPSGATYHEYAHVCEMHAQGFNTGPSGVWWECFADWMELQFEEVAVHYPDGAYTINQTSWLYQGHGRHYYDNWQIFEYLKEQPSYGYSWINTLWTQANGAYIFDAMATLDPSSNPDKVDQVKDNFNSMAAHNINWDYGWGQYFREDDINPDKWRTGRCELISKPGSTTVWRVPWDMSPQQMGYNIIPLKMPGKTGSAWTVTANLTGFVDAARGSDWRCTLVAVSDSGTQRYVQWHTGSNSITLSATENQCYLVVSGTPTFMAVSDSDDPRGLLREGLPYEVTFTNAVPSEYAPSANDPTKCPTVQDVAGKRCVSFDGNDKLVSTVNAPAGVVGNGDWSVAVWVYNPSISDAETYLSWSHRDGVANSNCEMIYGSNPSYGAAGHWGGSDMGFDGGVPSAGAWHHIAVTFDGATERIYVDGVQNAYEAKTLALYSGYPFNLGCGVSSGRVGTDFFAGSLYSARVFDRALTPTEVTTLATNLDYAKTNEVVFVEARALPLGTLTSWTNQGSVGGNFVPSIGAAHPNGGGYVENSASVASTAYVGPNAMVLGGAQVRDDARIEDYAVVEGNAQVYGNAIISGHGWVRGNGQVYGNAKVRDYASVADDALVYDNARLFEHATAWGGAPYNTKVCENGVMRGAASAWDESGGTNYIKSYSIWDGDATCGVNTTKGVLIGWLRDQAYADGLPDLNGLYCQYRLRDHTWRVDMGQVRNGLRSAGRRPDHHHRPQHQSQQRAQSERHEPVCGASPGYSRRQGHHDNGLDVLDRHGHQPEVLLDG